MDDSTFIEMLMERSGLDGRDAAERAAAATLGALGEVLPRFASQLLASQLPRALGAVLEAGRGELSPDLDGFYARVAEREGVPLGRAVEHAQVVGQLVAETVNAEGRRHLEVHLPAALAELFQPRPAASPPVTGSHRAVTAPPGHGRTLSEGRPGSQRPLAEAAEDHAHRESLARADNPHGDVKLSSATGLSPEREAETLAAGRPGSKHPLSEAEEG